MSKAKKIPISTRHFYPLDEIKQVALEAIRKEDSTRSYFCLAEIDVSGYGLASWKTLFQSFVEDTAINPEGLVNLVSKFHQWNRICKEEMNGKSSESFKNEKAKKLLMSALLNILSDKKSRLVPNLSIVAAKEPMTMIDEVMKVFEAEKDDDPILTKETTEFIEAQLKPLSDAKNKKSGDTQLNPNFVLCFFVYMLEQTWNAWKKVSLCEKSKKAKNTEKAIKLEKKLVLGLHTFYQMSQSENRTLKVEKKKKNAAKPFVLEVMKKNLPSEWLEVIPKIHSGTRTFFETVECLIWTVIFKFVDSKLESNKQILFILSCLMELSVQDLGLAHNEWYHLLHGLLFVVRESTIKWDVEQWIKNGAKQETSEKWESLYSNLPDITKENSKKIFERRQLKILPSQLDLYTSRVHGRSNLTTLSKILGTAGMNVDDWSDEEKEKSHGPGILFADPKKKANPKGEEPISNYTVIQFMFDRVCTSQDVYHEEAKAILLEEEAKSSHKNCVLTKFVNLQYQQVWTHNEYMSETVPEESVKKTEKQIQKEISEDLKEVKEKKETKKKKEKKQAKKKTESSEDEDSEDEKDKKPKKSKNEKKQKKQAKKKMESSEDEDSEEEKDKKPKKSKNEKKEKKETKETKKPKDEKKEAKEKKKDEPKKTKKRKREQESDDEESQKPKKKKKTEVIPNKPLEFSPSDCLSMNALTEEQWKDIENLPVARKPALLSKKAVRVDLKNVFKGPYRVDHVKDFTIVFNVVQRVKLLRDVLGETGLIPPIALVCNPAKTECYIRAENIHPLEKSVYEKHIENCTMPSKGTTVPIKVLDVVYSGHVHATKMLDLKEFDEHALIAFKGLCLRYLFAIGDSTWNKIILSDEKVFMVDLDDFRPEISYPADDKEELIISMLFTNKIKNTKRIHYLLNLVKSSLLSWVKKIKSKINEESFEVKESYQKFAYPVSYSQVQERISNLVSILEK